MILATFSSLVTGIFSMALCFLLDMCVGIVDETVQVCGAGFECSRVYKPVYGALEIDGFVF